MHRVYRYRLYPTCRQANAINAQLHSACALYNAALEQRREAWRCCRKSISYGDQSAELRSLRSAGLIDQEANFWSQQAILRQLDRAFASFLRRVRCGESPGYPRFKPPKRFRTLTWTMKGNAGGVGVTPNGRLRLQGIGCVKVKWHRPIPDGATLGEVKVTRCFGGRTAARYDVAFSVEVPDRTTRHPKCAAVGLDVGIRTFARLSTGEAVEGPRAGRRGRANLRRLSRAHARTRPGSRRRAKAAGRIARARERERNRRRDAAHKASRSIARRFALVAVEDLNLQGMLRSGPGKSALNREIADQGWGQFLLMLAYKAEEAGGRVVCVNPRGSSQT